MQINAVEPITWKIMTPKEGDFPCFCCHLTNATVFVDMTVNGIHAHNLKLPVCKKCAEYAQVNPDWLKEMLLNRKAVVE